MVGSGKKSYDLFTQERATTKQQLNPVLPKEIKNALGATAEDIIASDRDEIRETCQSLREAEKQQNEAEKINEEKEKAA